MKSKPSRPSASQLLVIDQDPLYADARESCILARRKVDELKREITRYESRDVPAFERWYRAAFRAQAVLSQEAAVTIQEQEQKLARIRDAHWKKFFAGASGIHAELGCEEDDGRRPRSRGPGDDQDWDADASDEGQARARRTRGRYDDEAGDFEDFKTSDYLNGYDEDEDGYQDHDGDDEWTRAPDGESVRRFEARLEREANARGWTYYSKRDGSEDDDREDRARARERSANPKTSGGSASPGIRPTPEADHLRCRIRDRYRALVRRLHPDLNSTLTADQKALWNHVQSAYRAGDLAQLDLLTALADAAASEAPSGQARGSSLFDLRRAALEIGRLCAPLVRRLREARKHRAWNFSALTDHTELERMIERELRAELARQRCHLDMLRGQMARFAARTGSDAEPVFEAELRFREI